jgi:hypothetical protein
MRRPIDEDASLTGLDRIAVKSRECSSTSPDAPGRTAPPVPSRNARPSVFCRVSGSELDDALRPPSGKNQLDHPTVNM